MQYDQQRQSDQQRQHDQQRQAGHRPRPTRRFTVWLTALGLAAGVTVAVTPTSALAAPAPDPRPGGSSAGAAPVDDLPNPLEAKRRALRQTAVSGVVSGRVKTEVRGGSTVAKVSTTDAAGGTRAKGRIPGPKDQYVELSRKTTDQIFVVLAEFGTQRAADYPDQDTDPTTPGPSTFEGPLHNAIPAPDRTVDNSTNWRADYTRQYYQDLYFDTDPGAESVANYYATQSSGRYSVQGTVTNWVKVPYNEARYGRSDGYPCESNVCSNTWALISDSVKAWVAGQKASGRTDAQIATDLKAFDRWDRYDFDNDGDFNESDGYIDHFQVVHAGGDQADGDPFQGEDAIWSHRWYAYGTDEGRTGPSYNLLGGTQIGTTGLWIGDYTIQPENGGLSVFVHEYGHDLGLPDSYDTSGLGDNNNEYWTLMAQSRLGAKGDKAIGTKPGDIGAWQKLQLGWLDYETLRAGQRRTLTLGPAEYNSDKPQAAVVVLPKKTVTTALGAPATGTRQWWSTKGDDLSTALTRTVDLTGKPSATLTFRTRYDIEKDYDYAYVQSSTDGGRTWTALDGKVGSRSFARDGSDRPALTGTVDAWTTATVPVTGGKVTQLRFFYRTDGAVQGNGLFADDITLKAAGTTLFTDGAESGTGGWTVSGFAAVGATSSSLFDNYYIAANRTYVGYDRYLETGPYNFGFGPARPDLVEHYSYQQGVLLTYWDTSQADNNTNEHPGRGLAMIVDAHPRTVYNLQGVPWRSRIQMYDAPFGLTPAQSFTLHIAGQPNYLRGQAGAPTFDDTQKWWFADQPNHGVKVPNTGTTMTVVSQSGTSAVVQFGTSKG